MANRFGDMKIGMFSNKTQPSLRGKAGEIRDLGPVLLQIWQAYMNSNLQVHRQIEIVLRGSCHLDEIINANKDDFCLPEAAWVDLVATCHSYLCEWYRVALYFKHEYMPILGITGKAHALLHCCLLGRWPGARTIHVVLSSTRHGCFSPI